MADVTVRLPSLLAAEAEGQNTFALHAPTVSAALRALPMRNLLFDEGGSLRPLVNVYVDGVDVRDRGGVDAELQDGAEIRIVAAIAGG